MTREEFFTLNVGDIVVDKFSRDPRIVKGKKFFSCDPSRFFGFIFESLRPNGNFKNFQGRLCKRRKETIICPYEAGRLTIYQK